MSDAAEQIRVWQEELDRTGRVDLRSGGRRAVRVLIICIVFTVIGVFLLLTGDRSDSLLAGWLAIGFFGVLGIPVAVLQLVRGGATAAVARDRIEIGGGVGVPWSDVVGVGVARVRGTGFVMLRLRSREAQQRAVAGRRGSRLLAPVSNALTGGTDLALPSTLAADPEVLATWLDGFLPADRA